MAGQLTFTRPPRARIDKECSSRTQSLLAGSALALDEDRDIGLRDALQLIPDSLHSRSLSENDIERRQIEAVEDSIE